MNDPDYFRLIGKLNREEIDFEKYLRRRGLNKANKLTKLREITLLINENPNILNLFLSKVSIGVRCLAMKTIFDLTDRQIEDNVSNVRSVVGDFIKGNLEIEMNEYPKSISLRNFSAELIRELSIIYDLPYQYLADQYAEFKLKNSFEEYERTNIKKSTLREIINESILEMKEKRVNRKIFGVKLENSFIEHLNVKHFNARIDIRKQFFTVEVFLENIQVIEMTTLMTIRNILNGLDVSGEIYYRDAFLRDNKKLILLIWVDENFLKPYYLQEHLLLEKQIYLD